MGTTPFSQANKGQKPLLKRGELCDGLNIVLKQKEEEETW
jgi:hypothetical protein